MNEFNGVHNCVEEGLKHVLLCRVLVESMKEVDDANSQIGSYYYVWSTNMNTHILPEYVVTFKTFSGIHANTCFLYFNDFVSFSYLFILLALSLFFIC